MRGWSEQGDRVPRDRDNPFTEIRFGLDEDGNISLVYVPEEGEQYSGFKVFKDLGGE